MKVDVAIFGGGVAGLWLLDELVRRGDCAVLLEASQLGSGQTVASQGILHGGLKYTLKGMLTRSALGIRDMPAVWRDSLAGKRPPDLTATRVRSPCCYLWRTDSVASRLGMFGAKLGLRVAPKTLADGERPQVLAGCPGTVARLEEPVIDPRSLIADFAARHATRILKIDTVNGLGFDLTAPGQIRSIALRDNFARQTLQLSPGRVVFTAGAGNAALREMAGLPSPVMQRRPLHMVVLRGDLPELNGHCVDGRKTRVTITSDRDANGRRVWQVGGEVAEAGVGMTPEQLIAHARRELRAAIPGLDVSAVEWSTYRVDRAEGLTAGNRRPETVRILREGNTITAWPTKLVLAPQLAQNVADGIVLNPSDPQIDESAFSAWPKPTVAEPPWEKAMLWRNDDAIASAGSAAA